MLLDLVVDLALHPLVVRGLVIARREAEAHCLGDVRGAEVGGEDDHGVLEVHRTALAVGQPTVLQHLQQRVVHLLVCLLDFIKEHYRERLAADLLGELATLLVTHVSRGCTDEPGCGVAVVELPHVDLNERVVITE